MLKVAVSLTDVNKLHSFSCQTTTKPTGKHLNKQKKIEKAEMRHSFYENPAIKILLEKYLSNQTNRLMSEELLLNDKRVEKHLTPPRFESLTSRSITICTDHSAIRPLVVDILQRTL